MKTPLQILEAHDYGWDRLGVECRQMNWHLELSTNEVTSRAGVKRINVIAKVVQPGPRPTVLARRDFSVPPEDGLDQRELDATARELRVYLQNRRVIVPMRDPED